MSELPQNQKAFIASNINHAEGNVDHIVNKRFFLDVSDGIFVDVGAARPDYLSVSALFRSKGWKVLAIEPNPAYEEHYQRLGLEILPFACGDHDEDGVDFVVVNSHGASYEGGNVSYESWSSLSIKDSYANLKSDYDVTNIKVSLRRLDSIIKTYAPEATEIDLISIDIEGWELDALSGLDFNVYKPRVLIVENLFYAAAYRSFMDKRGYVLWRRLTPNDIYVRSELLSPGEIWIARLINGVSTTVGRCRVLVGKFLRGRRSQE